MPWRALIPRAEAAPVMTGPWRPERKLMNDTRK